jgi:hypothetical protein
MDGPWRDIAAGLAAQSGAADRRRDAQVGPRPGRAPRIAVALEVTGRIRRRNRRTAFMCTIRISWAIQAKLAITGKSGQLAIPGESPRLVL